MKPIILLGEAFGANEAKINAAFVGASGIELIRMLSDAGVFALTSEDQAFISKFYNTGDPLCIDAIWRLHLEVHRANVFNLHPPGNDLATLCGPKADGVTGFPPLVRTKHLRREFIPQLERLADEICTVDPNLVIALGNTPLWALCGTTGISKVRGTTRLSTHTATGFKVLPTYHPAAVIRQWELRPTTVMDLAKAKREAASPEIRRTQRTMWLEPTLEDLEAFYEQHIANCELLSIDIETAGNLITCVGFAPSPWISLVVPFFDRRKKNKSYWSLEHEKIAWRFVKRVCESPIPKIGQNILYDVAFMWRSVGICIRNIKHDDMLCHHSLQPESLKSLGYLGSIYTDWPSWKGMRTETIKRDA